MSPRLRAFVYDALCVLVFVIIGTRNHDTDTGITGVLYVAAPFWMALSLAHVVPLLQKTGPKVLPHKYVVVGYTLVMGMVFRNFIFDRGTAVPFVIVATLFLSATMLGWRAVQERRSAKA